MNYINKKIVIGKTIKKHMKINNLTMKELGKKIDKGESTVAMWISGKSQPRLSTILSLTDIFNITTDQLLYGDCEDN